ncbi:MAG: prephenate dehydrogenase/arogenate dehydrogenase family protein [Cardiobacteriaceae bacterium]|nr:prephenate dehydrogenase/arogenate dehydrogenase family protein [Cardiobacteriaceae bacterium]
MQKIIFIGIGLIGGSLALALKKNNPRVEIYAIDTDEKNLEQAIKNKVIDKKADYSDIENADVIILACPVSASKSVFIEIAKHKLKPTVLISDVGSVKKSVIDAAKEVFGKVPENFIPAHPIAGLEKSGVQFAQDDLFKNNLTILTTSDNSDEKSLDKARKLWELTGARVEIMSAESHDLILAATSHLPHILAFLFIDVLAEKSPDGAIFNYAGSGFRDFSRIAGSSAQVWRDICMENKDAVLTLVDEYACKLQEFRNLLADKQKIEVEELFSRASRVRSKLS